MTEGEKIRVLVVDDISETRENIRKLLQFETDIEVVGAARSGKEAIQLVPETKPDVVLMDINMPDMDGIKATEIIRKDAPHLQVVILSVQGDHDYMRRAMLVGARDFLTKPPTVDDLTSTIRRAGKLAHEEKAKRTRVESTQSNNGLQVFPYPARKNGKVIMVFSPKGGVGCTTVAVNLAISLHNEETRAVLLDTDLQFGDVSLFLNEHGKNSILDLSTRVDELEEEIVNSVIIRNKTTGLDILASPSRPELAEKVKANQVGRLINYLKNIYSYIIIDTSSYVDDITLSILDVSDLIVLLSSQDIPAIKNNRLFLELLSTLDFPRDRIIFCLNKFDRRIAIPPEKIGEHLKLKIDSIIPLDEPVVIPSVNRGAPFVNTHKSQPASRGIVSLAEAVRSRLIKNVST
ncbi:response regulator [Chloroflexota bacterium]